MVGVHLDTLVERLRSSRPSGIQLKWRIGVKDAWDAIRCD